MLIKKQFQGHLVTVCTLNGHLASADVHTEECAENTDTTLSLGTAWPPAMANTTFWGRGGI